MLSQYAFVLIMSGLALVLPIAAILIGHFMGPRRPDPIKTAVYESGVETIGDTWVQFRAQYYLIGLVFVVFDVEAIFLFPIAVAYEQLSLFPVLAAIFFIVLLVIGLLYDWRKGALEWQ
ncbi:MAG: NADH-quinone oxidoreductase subunit A [Caldilineae bacterium]|nr:MAG: NADH-quinone oxidoreductase subunit A [Caldilineae bacterium]